MGMHDLPASLSTLSDIHTDYANRFSEQDAAGLLLEQVSNGENLWDRNNWNGHLTASAIVLNAKGTRCLFMHHKKLNIDLAPGGHCDPFEHPVESAERELREETGLHNVRLHNWHAAKKCPIDIDTHQIPPNSIKKEPPHFHHDFRYVFVSDPDRAMVLNEFEGTWLGWKEVDILGDLYPRVLERIRRYL